MRTHPPVSRPRAWLVLSALVLPLLAALAVLLGLGAPATATEAPTRPAGTVAHADKLPRVTVQGTLLNRAAGGAPVAGARFTVTSTSGKTYAGTTNASGQYKIVVPASDTGALTVTLDEKTLPEGVKLSEGQATKRTISKDDTTSIVSFSPALGPDNRHVETKWDRIPQLIYNGLLFGIIISMASLGLSMVFGTTGLTNFAHGELVTFGALMTYWGNAVLGLPMTLSVLIAVVLAGVFGWLQDSGMWRPLRHRGTGLIAMMIVSIGFQFLLRNLFQYFTGGRTLNYEDYVTPAGRDLFGWGVITYTWRDLVTIVVSLVVLFGVTIALARTRLGRATRAVSDNPALAASTGINVDRVISVVWIVGTALAGLSGAFLGFQLGVTFQIGQLVLLLLFSAVVVGGLGSVWGAMIGSLIVGLLIELSTLVIPSDMKNAGALLLLIVILLIKPQGLLGRSERIG